MNKRNNVPTATWLRLIAAALLSFAGASGCASDCELDDASCTASQVGTVEQAYVSAAKGDTATVVSETDSSAECALMNLGETTTTGVGPDGGSCVIKSEFSDCKWDKASRKCTCLATVVSVTGDCSSNGDEDTLGAGPPMYRLGW